MKVLNVALTAAVVMVVGVGSARAQAPAGNSIGIRGLASFGVSQMTASDSFETVLGSATLQDFGGGAQVTNLWRGLFAEVIVGRSKKSGERVFVDGSQVYSLGIPLTIVMNSLDVATGYRFNRGGRLVPYVGGGYTSTRYKETSSFARPGDDMDDRFSGVVVSGGVEVRTFPWLHVRGDARYRRVADALGRGGVSAVFGDDDLGGLRLGVLLAIGR